MLREARHLSSSVSETLRRFAAQSDSVRAAAITLALMAGLMIALLPLRWSAILIGGGALLIAAMAEPLIGLAIMLLAGLAEPLLGAAGLLPFSVGQAAFLLFAGSWLLRGLTDRQIRIPQLPITNYFLLYLTACALSVFFAQPASPKDSATELLKWIEMLIVAAIVSDAAGQKKITWVIGIICLVGLFQADVGIWQFQFRGHGPEGFRILGDHWRAYGTLEQPNPFGGFMGLVWPIAAMVAADTGVEMAKWIRINKPIRENPPNPRRPRTLIVFALAALTATATLLALFLSYSRGAWLGAAAAGFVMLIFWPRRRWIGLALAGGGLVAFLALYNLGLLPAGIANRFADVGDFAQVYDVRGIHINDTNFAIVERVAHWQAALNMADAHPLFGVGFGNYEAAYPDYRLINWEYGLGHAHNIYLNVLAETGAVGLIAYLILWGAIAAITIRTSQSSVVSRQSSVVSHRALAIGLLGGWTHLAVHQLLDNLYVGNIALYIGVLLGLLCIIAQRRHRLPITNNELPNADPPTFSRDYP